MEKWDKRGKHIIFFKGGGPKISYFGQILTPGPIFRRVLDIERAAQQGGATIRIPYDLWYPRYVQTYNQFTSGIHICWNKYNFF